jgi:hypothetical protein
VPEVRRVNAAGVTAEPRDGPQSPLPPSKRAALVRLLAAALVADVRSGMLTADSGASPPGNARMVVGRLHPRALTADGNAVREDCRITCSNDIGPAGRAP